MNGLFLHKVSIFAIMRSQFKIIGLAVPSIIKETKKRQSRLHSNHKVDYWVDYLEIHHEAKYEKLTVKLHVKENTSFAVEFINRLLTPYIEKKLFCVSFDDNLKLFTFKFNNSGALKFLLDINCISSKTYDEAIADSPLYSHSPSLEYRSLSASRLS